MTFTPLYDQVLVVPEKEANQTEAGIILPDTVKSLLKYCKVIAKGKGNRKENGSRYEMDFEVGDMVLVNARAGVPFVIDGREHRIIRDYEIIGVINE